MKYHGGLDWSGSPDAPDDSEAAELYVPCLVAVPSNDLLHEFLASTRQEFGLRRDYEFHGYELRKQPAILLRIVEFAITHAAVTAFLFNKSALISDFGPSVFYKPALLAPATGLIVIRQALKTTELEALTYDKPDVPGDRSKKFGTMVQREAKTLGCKSPKIRPADSAISGHVQLADVIAYVLQREEHGLSETIDLGRCVRKLPRGRNCTIRAGNANDLRPYLPP